MLKLYAICPAITCLLALKMRKRTSEKVKCCRCIIYFVSLLCTHEPHWRRNKRLTVEYKTSFPVVIQMWPDDKRTLIYVRNLYSSLPPCILTQKSQIQGTASFSLLNERTNETVRAANKVLNFTTHEVKISYHWRKLNPLWLPLSGLFQPA